MEDLNTNYRGVKFLDFSPNCFKSIPQDLQDQLNSKSDFDMAKSKLCCKDAEIDQAICQKSPPDQMVLLNTPWIRSGFKYKNQEAICRPVSGYLNFVDSFKISGGNIEHSIKKRKGFTSKLEVSADTKNLLCGGILNCDNCLEIHTGFQYDGYHGGQQQHHHSGFGIFTEMEDHWKINLKKEGSYMVYQTVLMYSYRLVFKNVSDASSALVQFRNWNLKPTTLRKEGQYYVYFFVPVYRNDPIAVCLPNDTIPRSTIPYHKMVDFLNETTDQWNHNQIYNNLS
eukprot:gene6702-8298_t